MRSKNTGAHKALETVIHLIFLLCGIVAVGFVLIISVYLILSGLPAIREIGLFRFLFGQVWDPTNTTTGAEYGILHDPGSIFAYLREFPECEQLTLF